MLVSCRNLGRSGKGRVCPVLCWIFTTLRVKGMELRGYATSIAAFFIVSLACSGCCGFGLRLFPRLDSLKRRMTEAGTLPSTSFCTSPLVLLVLGRLTGQFKVRLFPTPLLSVIGLFSVIVVAGLLGKAVLGILVNRTGKAVIMTSSGFSYKGRQ